MKKCLNSVEGLIGIYFTGSIVLGDYHEGKSDIDCTVILQSPIDIKKISKRFDCQYITYENIGKGNEVMWYTLKKYGVTVTGTPIDELNIPTTIYDVKSYVKTNVNTYWKNWFDSLRKPSIKRLKGLTDWSIEWCVCGITRMYYTLMEDDIASKRKVAEYGLTCLPESYRKILREALRIRVGGRKKQYRSRFVRRKDMIDYMEFMIGLINRLPCGIQ
ncbi:MAG: DUF4111 domain-containing protein [Oscillospiraceae bacterium]|nr:DUF4111 domain-containing protein [Oscillospiraceae bacterium]